LGSHQATFATSALSAGSHTITATYNGDVNFNGITSSPLTQTVNQANTTTTLTSSASSARAGQSVTFTATVSAVAPCVASPTGWVTFRDADTGQVLARVQLSVVAGSAQAQVTLSWPSAGTHHITATYNDFAPSDPDFNPNFNVSSASITETIT
jgi:hypothetical protein